jgi:hypothetical protein
MESIFKNTQARRSAFVSSRTFPLLRQSVLLLALISFLVLSFSSSAFAKSEVGYDPYAAVLKYPDSIDPDGANARDRNRIAARLLEQPFRPVGYAFGKMAEWTERHHVDEKAIWFLDELAQHGIHPKIKRPNEGSLGTIGLGGKIDVGKLIKYDPRSFSLDVFGGWAPNVGFDGTVVEAGAEYRYQEPGSAIYHEGLVQYGRSSSESFYGVGQETSLGEWMTYQQEELRFEATLGKNFSEIYDGSAAFIYQRMNIGNGNRQGVGKIKEHFVGSGVAGLDGGDLIGLKATFDYDTRDHDKDPKKGGYGGVEVSYMHDTGGDDFQYITVGGSAAHFFRLGSDRRVLAIRFAGEQNIDFGSDDVPFFNLARLGGSKPHHGSDLLRSYRFNRYFDEGLMVGNIEYRYSVYEYGDFQADAVALFDIGEVFEDLGDFEFDELNLSYGLGMNIKYRRHTILGFTAAHGSEGLELKTNSRVSF